MQHSIRLGRNFAVSPPGESGGVFSGGFAAPASRRGTAKSPLPARDTAPAETEAARILIVEDDFLIGAQVEDALQRAGYAVSWASSGERALKLAADERFDLVVMDIRLSGDIDGVETAVELFRRHGLRSIFATAHSDAAIVARAVPCKPHAWLTKPYSMPSLIEAVQKALASRHS